MPKKDAVTPEEKDKKEPPKTVNSAGFSSEKLLLFGGIPLTVIVAILIQYLYNTYYIEPLKERTFLNYTTLSLDRKSWTVSDPTTAFTLSTRHPESLKFGLLVGVAGGIKSNVRDFSACTWTEGDGCTFGSQVLNVDNDLSLTLKFATMGEAWTVSVVAQQDQHREPKEANLWFYLQSPDANRKITKTEEKPVQLSGSVSLFGNYSLGVSSDASNVEVFLVNDCSSIENVIGSLEKNEDVSVGQCAVIKVAVASTTTVTIPFSTQDSQVIEGKDFDDLYSFAVGDFQETFDRKYHLQDHGMPEFYQSMGRAAIANFLSSVTYNYGSLKAQGALNSQFSTQNVEQLNVLESRDLGISDIEDQLLPLHVLSSWDPRVAITIVESWLNLMNVNGDLPSLNGESMTLDYRTSHFAPIFVLLESILNHDFVVERLGANYDRLKTIAGKIQQSSVQYALCGSQARSHTVASKSLEDRGVRYLVARTMSKIAAKLDKDDDAKIYSELENSFSIDEFWDEDTKSFKDIMEDPVTRKVSHLTFHHIGSLLPLMMHMLPEDSEILKQILQSMEDTEKLWTPIGLKAFVRPNNEGNDMVTVVANFFVMKGLKHYSNVAGPSQALAHELYSKLRNNVIATMAREFRRTKTLHAFYNPSTATGFGPKNFAGGALVLQIMAEQFFE